MKNGTMDKTLLVEFPDGEEKEIEVSCEYDVCNDGIGAYEYWGQRCYDKGNDYIVITDTSYSKDGFSKEEISIIDAAIQKKIQSWENDGIDD